MRKQNWIIMAVCACVAYASHAAPLNAREANIIKARLVPAPKRVDLTDGPDVVLNDALAVTLACAKDGALAGEAGARDVQGVVRLPSEGDLRRAG
ncbi:MAG: hypothetical protein ACOX7Q_05460 [Kiritimatiellia bacterium]